MPFRSGRGLLLFLEGALATAALRWASSVHSRWFWGAGALLALYGGMSALIQRQTLRGTPVSRIATAAQGFVGLRGTGRELEGTPLVSPMKGRRCLWYRYEVERRLQREEWETVDSGVSDASFVLDDGSDRCLVDPEGAEIVTDHDEEWREGDTRYREWRLHAGDRLFVMGEFLTLRPDEGFNADAEVRDLLAEWKADQPALLRRFDLNHDGVLDAREWEMAQRLARGQVEKRRRELQAGPELHRVKAGGAKQLLISNENPDVVARRYLWQALAQLAFFLLCVAFVAGWSGPAWMHGGTIFSVNWQFGH